LSIARVRDVDGGRVQRRSLLKTGVLGGLALVVLGGGGLALRSGDRSSKPKRALLVLDDAGYAILVAVAGRVLAGTTADPLEIAHRVDASLMRTTVEARRDFGRVLGLLENALPGLLLRHSPTPFTLLDEAGQDAALHAWRDSPVALLRGAYHALRKLCLASHYATVEAGPEVGYGGPSLNKPAVAAIEARKPLFIAEALPTTTEMP
jgi:hypothetical protein